MTVPDTVSSRPVSAPSRAGRNLPMAIGVGVALGTLVVVSLLVAPWGFVVLASVAIVVASLELHVAFSRADPPLRAPVVAVVGGAASMPGSAYVGGPAGLLTAYGLTLVLVVTLRGWRRPEGAARDVAAGVLLATYGPFLASFAALMTAQPDGAARVFVFVAVTVASDIGGYACGVLWGRHPMSPSVSPKKSWEGFFGSMVACVVVGTVTVSTLLGGPWWAGSLLGLAVVGAATIGDLTESMMKRDIGIKDLGSILPGHGGLMDRLDSLLLSAPVTWAVLTATC